MPEYPLLSAGFAGAEIYDLVRESKAKMQVLLTEEQEAILVEREQVHNAEKKS
jgi:hypothetical protein